MKSIKTYLPNIHIISSDGSATNRDFLRAFYHDLSGPSLVLSEGKEFMHDHAAHITVVLNNLLVDATTSKRYQEQFTQDQRFVQKVHIKIEKMREEIQKGNPPVRLKVRSQETVYDERMLAACEAALSAACDLYTNQFYSDREDLFQTVEDLVFHKVFEWRRDNSWVEHFGWGMWEIGDYVGGMIKLVDSVAA